MNLRTTAVALLLAAAAGIGAWYYYDYAARHPTTSDAYLGMHLVRIAPQVSGPVKELAVRTNQAVEAGQQLLVIDPAPFELAVQQAEARLQQAKDALTAAEAQVVAAQARVAAAQATYREAHRHRARIRDLVAKGSASQDQGDVAEQAYMDARDNLAAAKAELAVAEAQRGAAGDANAAVKAAQAALGQARLDLEHTRISAPAAGTAGELDLRPGSFVAAGRDLFALVETDEVWVDANFKETDLPGIRPGQPARVTVDLLPGKTFEGEVESLSPASGSAFSLLPPENATGNWVKVTQRFAVRVRILDPVPGLRVGASAEVRVNTTRPAD
jgi:membrane fusion protein (multidrug efflux system)